MSNYREVRDAVGKEKADAVLLCVSKTRPIDEIMDAYREGARFFGENHVQEIEEKFSFVRPEGMKVFLIGHLQKNKVRKAVRLCDRIESVDSIEVAELISSECGKIGKTMDILIEFNSSGEKQKSGFLTEEEVISCVEKVSAMPFVHLIGLMTVGPLGGDREKNRMAFRKTKELYDKISSFCPLSVLSMGMSGDWREALLEGSNEVRIGTAIFGERDYSK